MEQGWELQVRGTAEQTGQWVAGREPVGSQGSINARWIDELYWLQPVTEAATPKSLVTLGDAKDSGTDEWLLSIPCQPIRLTHVSALTMFASQVGMPGAAWR